VRGSNTIGRAAPIQCRSERLPLTDRVALALKRAARRGLLSPNAKKSVGGEEEQAERSKHAYADAFNLTACFPSRSTFRRSATMNATSSA
jgi:hypothetical protein